MKCPQCGFKPTIGRPVKLDIHEVVRLFKQGQNKRAIAIKLKVTEGAVRAALKRVS